jgi:intracellular sulfur oxidation DsrE/DsrF family protein
MQIPFKLFIVECYNIRVKMARGAVTMGKAIIYACFILLAAGVSQAAETETAKNPKPPLQINRRTEIKEVIQINSSDTFLIGYSKQLIGARNLVDQYASLGMKPGKDYDVVIVFRAGGAQFLLTDDAYDKKVKQPHAQGNPNREMLEALNKAGVKMFECSLTMKALGYEPEDLLPFSAVVATGIGTIVDFEHSGFKEITP